MDTGNKKSSGPLGGEHFKFPAAGLLIVLLAMGRMAGVLAQQMAAGAPPTERVETRYVRPVPTGYQPSKGAGLTVEIAAGRAPYNGTHVHYSGGGLTMAPSATNYVYLDLSARCGPVANTTGFPPGKIPVASVTTTSEAISSITDERAWAASAVPGVVARLGTSRPGTGGVAPLWEGVRHRSEEHVRPSHTAGKTTVVLASGGLRRARAPGKAEAGAATSGDVPRPSNNPLDSSRGGAPFACTTGCAGSCGTNQFVTAVNSGGGPTCAQPAFSNLSGTATKAQLPGTTFFTDQSNTITTGTQDFSGAAHTLPAKVTLQANRPATCAIGEQFFASDTTLVPGQNVSLCTSANTWGQILTPTIDATLQTGADPCVQINAAWGAAALTGAVVDARGFNGTSTLTCSVNPLGNAAGRSGALLLGNQTYSIQVPWIVPDRVRVYGSGRGSANASGTTLQANTSLGWVLGGNIYNSGTLNTVTAGNVNVTGNTGTGWTSSLVGGLFLAGSGTSTVQATVVKVNDATHLVLSIPAQATLSNMTSYTITPAMVQFNPTNVGPVAFGVSISNLMVDCNNQPSGIPGGIGIQNWWAQELSYAQDVNIYRCAGIGLDIETAQAMNSGPYTNVAVGTDKPTLGAPITTTLCAEVRGASGIRGIHGMTCTSNGTPNVGIDVSSPGVTLEDLHLEGFSTGIEVGAHPTSSNLINDINIINVTGGTGAGAMNRLVDISQSSFSNNTEVNIFGLFAASGVVNTLVDNITTTTLTASNDPSLSYYILGQQGTATNRSRLTSSPNAVSLVQGGLTVNGALTVPVTTTSPTTSGTLAYNSTANQFQGGVNSSTGIFPTFSGTNPATGNCAKWGGNGTLADQGAVCGTVTSVGLSMPSEFVVTGSPITSSGTLAVTKANASANQVFAGPSSGAAAPPAFRLLVGADLPNPSSSSLGGVQSFAQVTHQWINSISTSGVPAASQPTLADVAAGASPTGTFDFSGANALKVPIASGFTTTTNGTIGYDSTNNQYHVAVNATDSKLPTFSIGNPPSGDCVNWGASGALGDAGGSCVVSISNIVTVSSIEFSGTGVNVSATAAGGAVVLASGLDGTSAQGSMTVRSGDISGGSGAVSAGNTTVRAGNNAASNTGSSAGNLILAAGLSTATSNTGAQGLIQLQISKIATVAVSAGQLVKLGSLTQDHVVLVATSDTTNFIGFAPSAIAGGNPGNIAIAGEVSNAIMGSGSCSIANFVIVDTTTAGDIKCTSTAPAAGTMIGWAESAQSTVGGAVKVLIDKR